MMYFVTLEPTDEKVVLKDSIVYLRNSKVVLVIKLKEETK